MEEHYDTVCSCGNPISTCKCMGPKKTVVIKNGCAHCRHAIKALAGLGQDDNAAVGQVTSSSVRASESIKDVSLQTKKFLIVMSLLAAAGMWFYLKW